MPSRSDNAGQKAIPYQEDEDCDNVSRRGVDDSNKEVVRDLQNLKYNVHASLWPGGF